MSGIQFTLGADPEVFVKHNGKAVSVFETGLPGNKKEPFKTQSGALQQDGFAAEFNIDPTPANDFNRFNQNIVATLAALRDNLNKGTKVYNLAIQPVMDFDPDYMAAQPEHVKELGCDPDFNAYTLKKNPMPDGDRAFRSGAGHIHFGWGADIPVDNEDHMEICAGFVRMLDATVGLFMTYIDREPRRRELYGKAGAFRPKPYGVEYRTPSNAWITTRDRRLMMHTMANFGISSQTQGLSIEKRTAGYDEESVRRIIDSGDWQTAEVIMDHYMSGRIFMASGSGTAWQNVKRHLNAEIAKAA